MLPAVRLTYKQLAAIKYLRNRVYLGVRRRGVTCATHTELKKLNEVTLLIEKLTGVQRLFND
jgi:hypothetical protein